jgi:hypothetical protein
VDEAAANLNDYVVAVRQRWRMIAFAGLAGVVLGVALHFGPLGGEGYTTSARLSLEDDTQLLSIALGRDVPKTRVSVTSVINAMNSSRFRAAALERADQAPAARNAIQATGDQDQLQVTVTAKGSTAEAALKLRDAAIEELAAFRRDQLLRRYGSVIATLTTRQNLARERLAEIDAAIAREPAGSARTLAFTHERVLIQEELSEAAAGLAAVEKYNVDGQDGMSISLTEGAQASSGLTLGVGVIAGALLGLLVSLGMVLVPRFFSPRVDSRAALERCGIPCLGVLGQTRGDRLVQVAMRHQMGDAVVTVLPGSGVSHETVTRLIPDAGASSVKVVGELADAPAGAPLVLVVKAGVKEDELRSTVHVARSIGAYPVGAVLVGVPDSGLAGALSR